MNVSRVVNWRHNHALSSGEIFSLFKPNIAVHDGLLSSDCFGACSFPGFHLPYAKLHFWDVSLYKIIQNNSSSSSGTGARLQEDLLTVMSPIFPSFLFASTLHMYQRNFYEMNKTDKCRGGLTWTESGKRVFILRFPSCLGAPLTNKWCCWTPFTKCSRVRTFFQILLVKRLWIAPSSPSSGTAAWMHWESSLARL